MASLNEILPFISELEQTSGVAFDISRFDVGKNFIRCVAHVPKLELYVKVMTPQPKPGKPLSSHLGVQFDSTGILETAVALDVADYVLEQRRIVQSKSGTKIRGLVVPIDRPMQAELCRRRYGKSAVKEAESAAVIINTSGDSLPLFSSYYRGVGNDDEPINEIGDGVEPFKWKFRTPKFGDKQAVFVAVVPEAETEVLVAYSERRLLDPKYKGLMTVNFRPIDGDFDDVTDKGEVQKLMSTVIEVVKSAVIDKADEIENKAGFEVKGVRYSGAGHEAGKAEQRERLFQAYARHLDVDIEDDGEWIIVTQSKEDD